jgi:hypothetical protein
MPTPSPDTLLASLTPQDISKLRRTVRDYVAAVLPGTGSVSDRPPDRKERLSTWLATGADVGYPAAELMLEIHGPTYTYFRTRSIQNLDCPTSQFTSTQGSIIAHCTAIVSVDTFATKASFTYVGGINVDVTVQRFDGQLKVTATQAHPTNPQ